MKVRQYCVAHLEPRVRVQRAPTRRYYLLTLILQRGNGAVRKDSFSFRKPRHALNACQSCFQNPLKPCEYENVYVDGLRFGFLLAPACRRLPERSVSRATSRSLYAICLPSYHDVTVQSNQYTTFSTFGDLIPRLLQQYHTQRVT